MTFAIRVTYTDVDTGERKDADLGVGGHLFGFAASGPKLWAAPIMFELQLEGFIRFGQWGFLEAHGAELAALESECRIVQTHLTEIRDSNISETKPSLGKVGDFASEEYILSRIDNLLSAIQKAKEVNGTLALR
jgi:hypothetical protein